MPPQAFSFYMDARVQWPIRIFSALAAMLGYVAALLSIAARVGPRSSRSRRSRSPDSLRGAGALGLPTSSSESSSSESTTWSDALISDAPRSQRLLLSRDGVDDRDGLAREWRRAGQRAQNAIATSSQLSVDLVTLGAPPTLIATANEDALDEIRHAKICFALARAIDSRSEEACAPSSITRRTPIPRARAAALAMIAAGCLESALSEGLSARMNTKLVRRAIDRSIKAALGEIASVEARHTKHAWAVIAWCLAEDEGGYEGSSVVAHALRAARTMILSRSTICIRREIPEVAAEGGWERWGIAGAALESQETEAVLQSIDRRIAELTTDRSTTERQRLAAA